MQALKAGAGRLPDYESEGEHDDGLRAQQRRRNGPTGRGFAWVLTAMARHYLDSLISGAKQAEAERFQLVIHATADQLAASGDDASLLDADGVFDADRDGSTQPVDSAEFAHGVPVRASTLHRLTCDCPSSTIIEGADGAALHVGRRHRRVSGRLRRAVETRDRGRCRAPGCTLTATQIHHIRHWAHGGPTCL